MTFARYRHLLTDKNPDVVAIVEMEKGEVVGLALAVSQEPELISLYVTPMHRRKGVGQRLLMALETEIARRGCSYINAVWVKGLPWAESYATLLQGQGWSKQQPHMIFYRAKTDRLIAASWFQSFDILPNGHAIFPWSNLQPEQLVKLRQKIRFEDWVPAELEPFNFLSDRVDGSVPEQKLNLAYVVWGEIVGWNFSHRVDAQNVRVSCTFVHPLLQQELLLLALWREFFRILAVTDYHYIYWHVSVQRKSMVVFNDKLMLPYLASRAEILRSRKVLNGQPDVN